MHVSERCLVILKFDTIRPEGFARLTAFLASSDNQDAKGDAVLWIKEAGQISARPVILKLTLQVEETSTLKSDPTMLGIDDVNGPTPRSYLNQALDALGVFPEKKS